MRKRDKRRACRCHGYHFPHHLGSVWCDVAPGRRTDADYEARYGAMAA